MQIRADQFREGGVPCGCGRSPTGLCIGWHALTEADYETKKNQWELDEYRRQANDLWNDSCTSGRPE